MADANTTTADSFENQSRCCASGRTRKGWSATEIATMVGGFIVFWPLGLVALGAKLIKGEVWPGSSQNSAPWKAYKAPEGGFAKAWESKWESKWDRKWQNTYRATTGNSAFDAYRKQQLDRLEAERRKLEEEQKAFAEYLHKLREAKDKDEFDRFMAERSSPPPPSETV
jgi:hypothetical protein